MYFAALATDYDGTLAEDGAVAEATLEALRLLKQSGRKLILVSGRELPDLRRVFSRLDLFDLAVLENGALLVDPASGEETPLGEEPHPRLARKRRIANTSNPFRRASMKARKHGEAVSTFTAGMFRNVPAGP